MKKHHIIPSTALAVVLAIAAGFLVVSCSQPPVDDPSVLVASVRQTEGWVRNFNPLSSRGDLLWPSRGGVYEPLLIFNVMSGEYVPWLANGFEWDATDQVVTFDLRPGVLWSDGTPFTSADVAFTFNLLRQNPAVDHNNVWSFLREVTTDGEHRVSFVFDHTVVPGLEHLAHQPIVPAHVWNEVDDPVSFLNPDPVATGPYTDVLHFDESVYEIGRNPHYWQTIERPVDRLRVLAFHNNAEANEAIRAGEVDWSGNFVPDTDATFLAADRENRSSWSPLIDGPIFLITNTTRAPFDDPRVRKALSMAIDRQRLADEAMQGTSRPADASCLDDAKIQYRIEEAVASDSWTNFDPDAAEALLDEAGFPRGDDGLRGSSETEPLSFEILGPGGWTDWMAIAEIITENLAAIGVEIQPVPLSVEEWQHRGQAGDFDLTISMTESRLTMYAMYRSMISSATVRPVGEQTLANWHRFSDEEADSFLLAYEMTSDPEIQDEIMRRVQLRFVETAPAIPLVLGPSWGIANCSRIVGFPTESDPYARLSPNSVPDTLLVLTRLQSRN